MGPVGNFLDHFKLYFDEFMIFQPNLRFNTETTLRLHPRGPSHRLGRYGRYGAHSPAGNGEPLHLWVLSPLVGRFGSWRFPARDMILVAPSTCLSRFITGSSMLAGAS